jgi:DnaJ-class molecular chaperone
MMSFYDVLGIDRLATVQEIKSAYTSRAKHIHPDKGGNSELFDRLVKARDALLDDRRHEQIDREQESRESRQAKQRSTAVQMSKFKITLANLYTSNVLTLKLNKPILCTECKGSGGKRQPCECIGYRPRSSTSTKSNIKSIRSQSSRSESSKSESSKFDPYQNYGLDYGLDYDASISAGPGANCSHGYDMGPGVSPSMDPSSSPSSSPSMGTDSDHYCSLCDSKGWYVSVPCTLCIGTRYIDSELPIQLHVYGEDDLRVPKKIIDENEHERTIHHIRLVEERHPTIRRHQYDLYIKLRINLVEALGAFNYEFTHLDMVKHIFQYDGIIRDGQRLCAPGLGLLKKDSGDRDISTPMTKYTTHGDLYVDFVVEFPKQLTDIKLGLEQLLTDKDLGKVRGDHVIKLVEPIVVVPL